MRNDSVERGKRTSITGLIIRFIIAAVVLLVTAFFTPGYAVANFWTALLQAVVIVGLDYLIQQITGINASPFGRGFSSFIVSAVIIYITQFVVPGVAVTVFGAVIAALIIGIIDAVIPVNII